MGSIYAGKVATEAVSPFSFLWDLGLSGINRVSPIMGGRGGFVDSPGFLSLSGALMPLTFTVNGQEVTVEQFEAMAQKKKPRPVREQKGYHKGFRVVGHAPGAMEEARTQRELDIEHYDKCSYQERAELGLEKPKPWDEDFWRRNSKKTALRSKPYEIYEAAELCADMARQDGWEDVEIIEVKKEVRNDSFMA